MSRLHFLTKPKSFSTSFNLFSTIERNVTVEVICSSRLIFKFFSRSFNTTAGHSTPSNNCCYKLINTLNESYLGIILILFLSVHKSIYFNICKSQQFVLKLKSHLPEIDIEKERAIFSYILLASGSMILISLQ